MRVTPEVVEPQSLATARKRVATVLRTEEEVLRKKVLKVVAEPEAAAAAEATAALLQDVLMAPNRGGWNDQFDTRSANVASVRSNQPVFSPNTAAAMQQAIAAYNQISMAGGWPMVPEGQVL